MLLLKILSFYAFFLAFNKMSFSQQLTGQCNVCLQNSVACVDADHFAICVGEPSMPTNFRTPCPAGTVCTDEADICMRSADGYRPICSRSNCGNCALTDGKFACLDESNYGLCFGAATHNQASVRPCPIGYVCNTASPDICASTLTANPSCLSAISTTITSTEESTTVTTTESSTVTNSESTTKITTEVTTISSTGSQTESAIESTSESTTTDASPSIITTTTPLNPNTFCANTARVGNFRPDGDTKCTDYIACYYLAGQYLGIKYSCNGFFNAASGVCQTTRPSDC